MWHTARRLRCEFGTYKASEWQRFCADHGISWAEFRGPAPVPAFTWQGVIFLARDLRIAEQCYWAWHEIAHLLLHSGEARWWKTRPQGDLTVSKFERQAADFVDFFPVWE